MAADRLLPGGGRPHAGGHPRRGVGARPDAAGALKRKKGRSRAPLPPLCSSAAATVVPVVAAAVAAAVPVAVAAATVVVASAHAAAIAAAAAAAQEDDDQDDPQAAVVVVPHMFHLTCRLLNHPMLESGKCSLAEKIFLLLLFTKEDIAP